MSATTESATAASEVLAAALQNAECLDDAKESTVDKGEAVQYVLGNPPPELKRLRNLESVIETSLRITSNQFTIGRFLPRGGILLWFSKEVACNRDAIQIMEGAVAKKVRNSIEEDKKSVILYRVPLWFDLDNFIDVLGEDLVSYRRFTKICRVLKSAEETETLELKFYIAEDPSKHMVGNHAFRTAPKMTAPLKICRVCKTIDPKHRPGSYTKIRCATCAGNHATNDHPVEDATVKCPICGEVHTFNACPLEKKCIQESTEEGPEILQRCTSSWRQQKT
jgi:hypothetical protein